MVWEARSPAPVPYLDIKSQDEDATMVNVHPSLDSIMHLDDIAHFQEVHNPVAFLPAGREKSLRVQYFPQ